MKEAHICVTCEKSFTKNRKNQVACSSFCAYEYRKLKARECSDRLYKQRVPRERYQKDCNEIVDKGNYLEMIIYNRIGKPIGKTLIDKQFRHIVEGRKWGFHGKYIATSKNNKSIFLHNEILNPKKGMYCDHINRDTTDNRIDNLREATPNQNCHNKGLLKNNTTGYTGVNKSRNKWFARIEYKGRIIPLGFYNTFDEAKMARTNAEQKYFGEFAPVGVLNG